MGITASEDHPLGQDAEMEGSNTDQPDSVRA
jgi:hypothetical protein